LQVLADSRIKRFPVALIERLITAFYAQITRFSNIKFKFEFDFVARPSYGEE
jgi:hypothetical protein